MHDARELWEQLAKIREQIAANTAHLAEHMRRTDLLEKRMDNFWNKALLAISILGGVLTLVKAAQGLL